MREVLCTGRALPLQRWDEESSSQLALSLGVFCVHVRVVPLSSASRGTTCLCTTAQPGGLEKGGEVPYSVVISFLSPGWSNEVHSSCPIATPALGCA